MVNFTLEANLWNKLGTKALKTSRNEDDQGTCFECREAHCHRLDNCLCLDFSKETSFVHVAQDTFLWE